MIPGPGRLAKIVNRMGLYWQNTLKLLAGASYSNPQHTILCDCQKGSFCS
jgi:hypothetical protein